MQGKLLEPNLNTVLCGVIGNGVPGGVESQLSSLICLGIEDLDDFGPGGLLAVVDLTQVEQVALHPAASTNTDLFGDGPVAMFFAVLEPPMTVEKRTQTGVRFPVFWKSAARV